MSASVILLIVLTVVVAALAIYRYAVARNEDNFLHMADSAGQQISGQLKTHSEPDRPRRDGLDRGDGSLRNRPSGVFPVQRIRAARPVLNAVSRRLRDTAQLSAQF